MFRVIYINVFFLLVLLAVLELVFGTWFSDVHALHQFTKPRDIRIERTNPLSEDPQVIVYTRDENGFRGLNGDVSEIDIITVGGSTTDQRFLDDSQTYQAFLTDLFAQDGHPLVIANAGIDGQSTYGHIENFASWFNLIDGLRTRYFLFYVGINDALILAENEAYDSNLAQSDRLKLQLYIREKSAFYQLYLIAKRAWFTPNLDHSFEKSNFAIGDDLVNVPRLSPEALATPEVTNALAALTDRIEQLAELSRALGAQPIFVTQRSTAWNRSGGEYVGVPEIAPGFLSNIDRRFGSVNGIDIYNIERSVADAISAGCRNARAHCFDLMADVEFSLSSDYYDDIHTTSEGSEKIARYLYEKLNGINDF